MEGLDDVLVVKREHQLHLVLNGCAGVAVVLDLVMPGMDGVEFLDRFRRIPQHLRTPVLIWTMKDLTAAEQAQLRQSAQGIVSKNGGTPSTVIAQLKALLPEAR